MRRYAMFAAWNLNGENVAIAYRRAEGRCDQLPALAHKLSDNPVTPFAAGTPVADGAA
jgi:hypothetical protein